MFETLIIFLSISNGLRSTTYGYSENNCGDYEDIPKSCSTSSKTASGVQFDPNDTHIAIAYPKTHRLKATTIGIKTADSKCIKVKIVDKMHERWIGSRGFDVSPKVQSLLTGKPPTKYWSDRVYVCTP